MLASRHLHTAVPPPRSLKPNSGILTLAHAKAFLSRRAASSTQASLFRQCKEFPRMVLKLFNFCLFALNPQLSSHCTAEVAGAKSLQPASPTLTHCPREAPGTLAAAYPASPAAERRLFEDLEIPASYRDISVRLAPELSLHFEDRRLRTVGASSSTGSLSPLLLPSAPCHRHPFLLPFPPLSSSCLSPSTFHSHPQISIVSREH